jgi:hypothetical protein
MESPAETVNESVDRAEKKSMFTRVTAGVHHDARCMTVADNRADPLQLAPVELQLMCVSPAGQQR